MVASIYSERSKSGFPLSIGTGLAFESIFEPTIEVFDPERIVPDTKDINEFNVLLVNISTLLRNIIQSLNCDFDTLVKKVGNNEVMDTLLDEINFIELLCGQNNVNVKFYINTYKFVKSVYGKTPGKLRIAKTSKQHFINDINEYCLKKLMKEDDVIKFDSYVKLTKEDNCLIFTHIPWDLLAWNKFLNLELLESHTGLIKSRAYWNSKYYQVPDTDMSFLPFMEYLLTTFGDNVMFSPDSISKRKDVIKQLKIKRVNALSSELTLSFITN